MAKIRLPCLALKATTSNLLAMPVCGGSMLKNVLCDRDGTIIYDKHYLAAPDGVELLPGATRGLRNLYDSGCKIFVVSNQSGIGRGMFSLDDYKACARCLNKLLYEDGVKISGTVFCPHDPNSGAECDCRKPAIGMWTNLRIRHSLENSQSVMIGDKSADIMFGKNAGLAATVLVLTGKGLETAQDYGLATKHPALVAFGYYELPANPNLPDCVALDLEWAASYILQKNGAKQADE